MTKTKILWLSDCSVTNNSGFSKVSLELLKRLSSLPEYEIAELGINNKTGVGYKFQPNWKIYLSGKKPHCEDVFVETVKDFKPDVVISLLDWNMSGFINDYNVVPIDVRNSFKGISHLPIDGGPISTVGLNILAGWNAIACIHPYGKQVLIDGFTRLIEKTKDECKSLLKDKLHDTKEISVDIDSIINYKVIQAHNYARVINNISVINHGVDLNTYYVSNYKKELRQKFNIQENEFVFVYFGRNSPRKQQPIVMQAFNYVLKKYTNSRLILGCKIKDVGWDLSEVASKIGVNTDKILFTDNSSAIASEGLTDEQVADIYRVSDCFVSPCVGGGFELCHLESMACGLPQIGVNGAGSITEMVRDHGILTQAQSWYLGGQFGPYNRPLVSPKDLAESMKNMIKSKDKREKWSTAAVNFANKPEFNWDFAASEFKSLIDKVLLDDSVCVEGRSE